jgi:hypothetical protein
MDRPVNFYYSFESYIPLGFDLLTNDLGDPVTVNFEKWEKINGISVFKKAIFRQGNQVFNYDFRDINFNHADRKDLESKLGLIK